MRELTVNTPMEIDYPCEIEINILPPSQLAEKKKYPEV